MSVWDITVYRRTYEVIICRKTDNYLCLEVLYCSVFLRWNTALQRIKVSTELDNDPIREAAGEDQQLEKAVQVALEQLKDRKPLPGVPAPRTFKDLGLPERF